MSLVAKVFKDLFSSKGELSPPPLPVASVDEWSRRIADLLREENFAQASALCDEALALYPGHPQLQALKHDTAYDEMTVAMEDYFPGLRYLDWLKWLHVQLRPATYLEIGVETGRSLQYTLSPTRAIGIDPDMRITFGQDNWVKLFKQTSDDFFATRHLPEEFGTDTLDLAFIDGLHTFDQALKDFMHIERFSHRKTIVLFHDIYPVVPVTAQRERCSTVWLGDTWKAMRVLMQSRPDLQVFTIPTFPSGLGVVSNLDCTSTVLWDDFDAICAHAMAMPLADFWPDRPGQLRAVPNDFAVVAGLLGLPGQ